MATAAVLTERAESLGLPITKNAFEGTLENPVPPLRWSGITSGYGVQTTETMWRGKKTRQKMESSSTEMRSRCMR